MAFTSSGESIKQRLVSCKKETDSSGYVVIASCRTAAKISLRIFKQFKQKRVQFIVKTYFAWKAFVVSTALLWKKHSCYKSNSRLRVTLIIYDRKVISGNLKNWLLPMKNKWKWKWISSHRQGSLNWRCVLKLWSSSWASLHKMVSCHFDLVKKREVWGREKFGK